MRWTANREGRRGFILILTLTLLAMLVLLVLAMSALAKADTRRAAVARAQVQARQNALLAMRLALGELQRLAGPDDRVTGMAGLTGVPAGAGQGTRHWCGVWTTDGALLGWLASGGEEGLLPTLTGPDVVPILAEGALGADDTDKEHVRVLRRSIPAVTPGRVVGHYAYWIGDEGVKLSATDLTQPAIGAGWPHAVSELIPTLTPGAPKLAQVLTYPQLAYVPSPTLSPGGLQSNLHSLAVAHLVIADAPTGPQLRAGAINVNTTNVRLWRGVAATYNQARPGAPLAITTRTFANRLRDGLPGQTGPGKLAQGPFQSAAAFAASSLLDTALKDSGVKRDEFLAAIGPLFTVRSDTFRLRGYGDVSDLIDPSQTTATAGVEAIVQRVPAALGGHGRKFTVTSVRWLGPGDQ